jgi:hypothetical protein
VTLDHGRIGIAGSVLFAFNSADLQPEGRQLLKSLAAPLGAYLKARDEVLMVSGFTDDRAVRAGGKGASATLCRQLGAFGPAGADRHAGADRGRRAGRQCVCRRLRRAAAGGLQRRCRGPGPQPPGGDGADGAAGPRQPAAASAPKAPEAAASHG